MACAMCEAHICDALRNAFPDARKIKASHRRKTAVFLTDRQPDPETVEKVIDATGYHYLGTDFETVR